MGLVTGLFMREYYYMVGTNPSWYKRVRIPRGVVNGLEFCFWKENPISLNERYLGELAMLVSASMTVKSDASHGAYAAILKIGNSISKAH